MRSREQVAREVHAVSLARGLDELATVICLMAISTEVGADDDQGNRQWWCPWNRNDPTSENYAHDSESDDGRSVGYLQQQNEVPGEAPPPAHDWWGPMSSRMTLPRAADVFLERLDDNYTDAADNPGMAGEFAQRVQGSQFPDRYAGKWAEAWDVLRRAFTNQPAPSPTTPPAPAPAPAPTPTPGGNVVPTIKPNPAWRGDPVYLPELLKAFGLDVSTYSDTGDDGETITWDQIGHGDYGQIKWVVWHHTGSVNETDQGIARHPELGLAANMLVHPDGHVTLTGSGIAWGAGVGVYPGAPEDNINQIAINIECAYGPDAQGKYTIRWPDEQIVAMVAIGAAISWFLGDTLPVDHQIGHKEWAGADNPLGINKQGKPDPGNLDMGWFRGEIAKRMAEGPTGVAAIGGAPATGGGPAPDQPQGPLTFDQWRDQATDRDLLVWIVNQLGPGDPSWASAGSTLRDRVFGVNQPATKAAPAKKAATKAKAKAAAKPAAGQE